MIECDPATILPFDSEILQKLRSSFGLEFDSDYESHVGQFNGGTPRSPYFPIGGTLHRIGWMVAMLDDECPLPAPFQPATYHHEYDTRIEDRSLPTLIDHEIDPFFWAERLIPFAALYTHGEPPKSLRLYSYDWNPADCLCFDRSTVPQSIVYCNADRLVEEYIRHDELCDQSMKEGGEPDAEVNYDYFMTHVADSFVDFCSTLVDKPNE